MGLIIVFTVFTVLALACLLLFQILFMDDLYEWSKRRSIRSAGEQIASAVGTDEAKDYASYWSVKEQCTVYITDDKGQTLYRDLPLEIESETDLLTAENLRRLYEAAKENGGEYEMQSDVMLSVPNERGNGMPRETGVPSKPDKQPGGRPDMPPNVAAPEEVQAISTDVIYARLTTDSQTGDPRMVVLTSVLTPVNAAVRTLVFQVIVAAFVLVSLAGLLGFIVARFIARPIVDVNRAAKTLAGGRYVPPAAGGYREIAELKDTLARTAVELQKSEQLQRELVANLSHDLRTPLTMITGYSEAIRDLPGENSAENIDVIIDEAERLTRLVNDVLDLSKLQSGTQVLSTAPVDLCVTVSGVAERVRRMTEKDGYTITVDGEKNMLVTADEVRLSQVIYNLLLNALAYTGEDRCVTVSCTTEGKCARVAFTDSGNGIPADELEHIWQRYYRVHKEEPLRDSMSSGLGLSIVKAIVELHGGRCGVYSTVGKGSTFFFELPLIR